MKILQVMAGAPEGGAETFLKARWRWPMAA